MISNAVPRTVGIEPSCDYFGKQSPGQTHQLKSGSADQSRTNHAGKPIKGEHKVRLYGELAAFRIELVSGRGVAGAAVLEG
jgi:hypothetical protein